MLRHIGGIAVAMLLISCDEIREGSRERTGLEPWRAQTILGGGDGSGGNRAQGSVTRGGQVRAGQGTIFPGRQPLFREAGFINEDGQRTFSLNLVDVSVAEAAAAILGQLLNENYIIDPSVSGTVNIRSTRPITRTTAVEVFELALKQNNAAMIRRGDVFSIVPISGDLSLGASTSRDIMPGFTLRVIPLQNIGAQEMATILQPFAQNGVVGIDAQRNIIVLAGTSADQRAWEKTIESFDVDWLANRSVGIFPIRGRSAQSIVRGLELVVETDESFEPIAVFETIPENNSILVVAKTPNALQAMSGWIQRLTQEGNNDAQVFSYDMKYARAADLAPVLGQILGISIESDGSGNAPAGQDPNVDLASFDADLSGSFNETRIVASERTNTLLIHATSDEYQRVLGILHRLDVPPRQVLVEATIVEVSLNDSLRYGVQYFFEEDGDSIGLSAGQTRAISPNLPGFSLVLDTPARAVVDALDDVTSINVVSSPNLMILNNESARLVVGDQVPVATRQSQDGSQNDEIFVSTVEFRDTGVIFEVTPRINSSGSVILNIAQEVSSVSAASAETLTPTISQRIINSSVSVESGETIALGGLFSNRSTKGNSGVPILKDIPLAGNLFGRTNNTAAQTELLVLITPRIVNNSVDARRVTRQLRERVTQLRLDDASLSNSARVPSLRTSNSLLVEQSSQRNSDQSIGSLVSQALAEPQQPGYWAVLAAFQTERDAKRYWPRLRRQHRATLGRLDPVYQPRGTLTAIQVGPYTEAQASQICATVQGHCRVLR